MKPGTFTELVMWLVKLLQHESIDNLLPGTFTELVKLLVKWLVKPLQHDFRHIY